MRYTVPWLGLGQHGPTDSDEMSGRVLHVVQLVGVMCRRHGQPISCDSLSIALGTVFESILEPLETRKIVDILANTIKLARLLGLIEIRSRGDVRATETMMRTITWWDEADT